MSDFHDVVAEYLAQVDEGQEVDPAQIICAHPEHADQLEKFFDNLGVLYKTIEFTLGTDESEVNSSGETSGETLGDFRIIRELGRGGMGVVYEALNQKIGRRVALKVMHRAAALDAERLARFENEAKAIASLSHDNIVPVYAVGEQDGAHYFAMKLIDGQTLTNAAEFETGPALSTETPPIAADETNADGSSAQEPLLPGIPQFPVASQARGFDRVCTVITDVASAIDHAHKNGIVHRDIKPSNLLMDRSGKVWVTDFGLARLEQEITMTATGDVLGTVQYMSPEQAQGENDIDRRSDVYSLGVVLYRLLTGELPFRGKHRAVLHRVINDEPATPRSLNPSIPRDLETICLKCLQKKPQSRYQTAEALADDLQRFQVGKPISARPAGFLERSWKWCARHRSAAAAIALGVLSAVTIVGLSLNYARREANLNSKLSNSLKTSERLRIEGNAARDLATNRADELRMQGYSRDMRQAYQAWNTGWPDEVETLLQDQIPIGKETDYRDTSWYVLQKLVRREPPIELRGHEGAVHDVAVFDSGKRMATVGQDATIRIWNLETNSLEFTLRDTRPTMVLPDALTGLWNQFSGNATSLSISNTGPEYLAVAVSPDGKKLVTGNLVLSLWDLETQTRERDLAMFPTRIASIDFSPDGKLVVAHSRSEIVKVISTEEGAMWDVTSGHGTGRIAFFDNGSKLTVPTRHRSSEESGFSTQ